MGTGFENGVRLFNDGAFWEAHEAWEGEWLRRPKGSDERRFYQGLIQLAAALLHRERAKAAPARSVAPALRCYRSAMAKLDGLPARMHGVDVATVRREAAACFAPLEAGADAATWPPTLRLEVR